MKNNLLIAFAGFVFMFVNSLTVKGEDHMKLTSPDFSSNEFIPSEFSCKGSGINPALNIQDVPDNVKSLALIVDDPDAPMGTWVHWVVFNIPGEITVIDHDTVPGTQGKNDFKRLEYGGPCPPSGTHHYYFKLYALDADLDLKEGVSKKELLAAMDGHIIEQAELVGLFKK